MPVEYIFHGKSRSDAVIYPVCGRGRDFIWFGVVPHSPLPKSRSHTGTVLSRAIAQVDTRPFPGFNVPINFEFLQCAVAFLWLFPGELSKEM